MRQRIKSGLFVLSDIILLAVSFFFGISYSSWICFWIDNGWIRWKNASCAGNINNYKNCHIYTIQAVPQPVALCRGIWTGQCFSCVRHFQWHFVCVCMVYTASYSSQYFCYNRYDRRFLYWRFPLCLSLIQKACIRQRN